MAAEEQQDGQKTLVAFIVGLLIGGMIVWAFGGDDATAPVSDRTTTESSTEKNTKSNEEVEDKTVSETESVITPVLQVGEGAVVVADHLSVPVSVGVLAEGNL